MVLHDVLLTRHQFISKMPESQMAEFTDLDISGVVQLHEPTHLSSKAGDPLVILA